MFSEWSGFQEQEIINRRAGVGLDHFDVLSVETGKTCRQNANSLVSRRQMMLVVVLIKYLLSFLCR